MELEYVRSDEEGIKNIASELKSLRWEVAEMNRSLKDIANALIALRGI